MFYFFVRGIQILNTMIASLSFYELYSAAGGKYRIFIIFIFAQIRDRLGSRMPKTHAG